MRHQFLFTCHGTNQACQLWHSSLRDPLLNVKKVKMNIPPLMKTHTLLAAFEVLSCFPLVLPASNPNEKHLCLVVCPALDCSQLCPSAQVSKESASSSVCVGSFSFQLFLILLDMLCQVLQSVFFFSLLVMNSSPCQRPIWFPHVVTRYLL